MANPLNAPWDSSPYNNAGGAFPGTEGLTTAWDTLRGWFTKGAQAGYNIMEDEINAMNGYFS